MKDKVRRIHGVDTSQRYLDICREKLKGQSNIHFHPLDRNDYTDLSFLHPEKFNKIVCLGVVHYYDSVSHVEELIEQVKKVAHPGASFIIADIVTGKRSFMDTLGYLLDSLRRHYFLKLSRFIYNIRKSPYNRILSSKGYLVLSRSTLEKIIAAHSLDAVILDQQLTPNRNRIHLLIRF